MNTQPEIFPMKQQAMDRVGELSVEEQSLKPDKVYDSSNNWEERNLSLSWRVPNTNFLT
jgi:hypothetical protein